MLDIEQQNIITLIKVAIISLFVYDLYTTMVYTNLLKILKSGNIIKDFCI